MKLFRIIPAIILILLASTADSKAANYLLDKGARCEETAERAGFTKELVDAGEFTLVAYSRVKNPGKTLVIYIEGDGASWETRSRISDDPTPRDTLVVKLSSLDPSANVVYLARPGQYTFIGASECSPSYWAEERFSRIVVDAMNEAVEFLKKKYGAGEVSLIGYSGGGAVAVLIASQRNDVVSLRTVAGNLDITAVSEHNGVSPLKGSLNPIGLASTIATLPQRHFAGSKDEVVPPSIAKSFVERSGNPDQDRVTIVQGATHTTGWEERWPELLAMPVE